MNIELIGVLFLVAMLALIAIGIPIAFAMLATATVGFFVVGGSLHAETQLVLNLMDRATSFPLTAIPLYILMGQLVFRCGLASDFYDCLYKWLGWLPGGLAIASVMAAGGFGAVSGGGVTAVATLGPTCIPEMQRYKYNRSLATGSIAAAGTLGALIPPSIFMIVYGVWTETSIGALFIGGIVPGIIMMLVFAAIVFGMCVFKPELGPRGPSFTMGERVGSLVKLLPILLVFFTIIGGIYSGAFGPSEAAAVGVTGVLLITLLMRRLTWTGIREAILNTMRTAAMVFVIIVAGHVIGRFIVLTDLTSNLVLLISHLDLPFLGLIALITLVYIVLGMVLDVWGMMILTVPFIFPVMVEMGVDPIWYGIYVTIMVELALITPPVGVNVYVMAKVVPEVPLAEIFKGALPFFFGALLVVALICVERDIVTWLPRLAFG